MRVVVVALIMAVVGFVVQLFLPWWSIALVAFIIGYLGKLTGWGSVGAGLLGAGGLWFVYALWLNVANDSLLAGRVGKLFSLPEPLLLVLVSTIIAALLGALSAYSGRSLRKLLA